MSGVFGFRDVGIRLRDVAGGKLRASPPKRFRDVLKWEFPTIKDTLFWGPYKKDLAIFGTI